MKSRYIETGLNYIVIIGLVGLAYRWHETVFRFVENYPSLLAIVGTAVLGSLGFAYKRRIVSKAQKSEFFAQTELNSPPINKGRYSDRLAYVLAEFCQLAYFEVEKERDSFVRFVEEAKTVVADKTKTDSTVLDTVLKLYFRASHNSSTDAINIMREQDLADLLAAHGYEYLPPYINCGNVQGFVCLRKDIEHPYVVVAFRGSEKKVDDWLTNTDAVPAPLPEGQTGKVHSGFYKDFKSIEAQLKRQIAKAHEKLGDTAAPVYFTGHSLGGAVAVIATKELMPDAPGACYTFGGPRVGDYSYFEFVKTPIYRVVNSSDIVPRVPPSFLITVLVKVFALLRQLAANYAFIERSLAWLEGWLNRLKDYRHFGDLRYLTDTDATATHKVLLLRNPAPQDVLLWFWRSVSVSFGMPVKSHSLAIYRNKLRYVALQRFNKT